MMTRDDEYRKRATAVEEQARAAKNDLDRGSWLRVAEGWLGLLRKRPQSDDPEHPK